MYIHPQHSMYFIYMHFCCATLHMGAWGALYMVCMAGGCVCMRDDTLPYILLTYNTLPSTN